MDTTPQAQRSEIQVVAQVSERLRARLPHLRPEVIDQVVAEALHEFDGRPVRDFIPILVERDVLDRFRGSAQDRAAPMATRSLAPPPEPRLPQEERPHV